MTKACVENKLRTGRPSRWTPYDDYVALQAERDALRSRNAELVEALQGIANLALAPMVDMADPPEERARDWSHVAARAWETARAVLAKAPE